MSRVTKDPAAPPAPAEPLTTSARVAVFGIVVAVLLVGWVLGLVIDATAARSSCVEACAPRAPAYTEGICYCDPAKELP